MKLRLLLILCSFILGISLQVAAEDVKITIKAENTSCQDNSCLWVKFKNSKDWMPLTAAIEGFAYEEGYQYNLIVDRNKPKNEKDINKHTYKLVKIISKTMVVLPPHQSYTQIIDKKWYLSYFHEQDISNQGMYMQLDAQNNRIALFGGCNNYYGRYTTNHKTMDFGPMAGTKKACPSGGEVEQHFSNAFSNKHLNFVLSDGYLLLYNNGRHVMSFSETPVLKELEYLSQYDWKLYKIYDTLMTNKRIRTFISFDQHNNNIYGFDGCNHISGKTEIFKNTIRFTNTMTTMKACMDKDVLDISRLYGQLLNDEMLTYALTDDKLIFYSGGKPFLTFIQKAKGKK